jgi:hypothetical protein
MSDEIREDLVTPYLEKITWQHRLPKFTAAVQALVEGPALIGDLLLTYRDKFDLDTAVGAQLDVVGEWVGISRTIATLLDNVWFSWDDESVGWDVGLWFKAFQLTTGPHTLDDEHYRTLLKARVVANYWDGTVEGAYTAWDTLFLPEDYHIFIQDGMAAAIHEFKFDAYDWEGWDQAAWTLFDAPRANYLRNSGLIGARVGWPGTLPTYWELVSGLDLDIESKYVERTTSVDVLELVFHGTTIGSETLLFFEAVTPDHITVETGEVWTLSVYYQLLDGAATITGTELFIQAISASGNILHEYTAPIETAPSAFQRASVTAVIPINVVSIRVGIRFLHTHAASVAHHSVLLGQPQLELGVTAPTAPIRTIGAAHVVHVPSVPNIRLTGGMRMIFGLIAPYTEPPPLPDYFSFDAFTSETTTGARTNARAVGIPIVLHGGFMTASIAGSGSLSANVTVV